VEPTECQPSSTECAEPPRRTVPGRNGGTLTPFAPGKSGNPHRGPDKFPRRNVVRAQYLGALSGQGGGWPVLDADGRVKIGEDGRVVMVEGASPSEMLDSNVLAYKIISARAARGLDLDLFLRMQRDAHEALQPGKDEIADDKDREPIRAVFETVQAAPPAVTPPTPTAAPAESARPLEVDGQLYE